MTWPETFGDTTAEYVASHDAAGFVGETSALFWATGPDTISFLQGIITQDVEGMAVGSVARSLLLEPRGKLAAVLWLLRDEDRVGFITDADRIEETMEALGRWRIRVDVDLEADPRPVYDIWGPEPGADSGEGWTEVDGVLTATLVTEPLRRTVVVGAEASELEARGIVPIGSLVATTLRIESGEPRMGVDIDDKTIPQESGLVDASVAFDKGCYLGQELVARIDSRGHVNRHLRGIRLHDAVLPPNGAEIVVEDAVVGSITSVGESLAVRAPVGLALVRREVDPGSSVELRWEGGSASATVEELPLLTSSP